MTGLKGQRILLGVSGGIAAYKAAELVRRLLAGGRLLAGHLLPRRLEDALEVRTQAVLIAHEYGLAAG